jgi:hypothetical protein
MKYAILLTGIIPLFISFFGFICGNEKDAAVAESKSEKIEYHVTPSQLYNSWTSQKLSLHHPDRIFLYTGKRIEITGTIFQSKMSVGGSDFYAEADEYEWRIITLSDSIFDDGRHAAYQVNCCLSDRYHNDTLLYDKNIKQLKVGQKVKIEGVCEEPLYDQILYPTAITYMSIDDCVVVH